MEPSLEGPSSQGEDGSVRNSKAYHQRYRNTNSVSSMLDHLQWESLEARKSLIQDIAEISASTFLGVQNVEFSGRGGGSEN